MSLFSFFIRKTKGLKILNRIKSWSSSRKLISTILCYILWALAYPPFVLGPLVLFLFVPLFLITQSLTKKQAFYYHFIGGFFYNAIMYYWLYHVMKVGPALIILSGVLLGVSVLSLLNGYIGLWMKYLENKRGGLFLFALFWVGFEVARTKGQMSFPWNHLGYTLGGHLSVIQISSWIGVFGLSLLIMGSNVWIVKCLSIQKYKSLWMGLLLWVGVLVYGWSQLNRVYPESVKKADIALVQPAVQQTKKWGLDYYNNVIAQTYGVMDTADLENADLVILAETAVPTLFKYMAETKNELKQKAVELNSNILVGSLDYEPMDHPVRKRKFFNSAFLLSSKAIEPMKQYSKIHLVPFSERLPFDNIFPVINYVDLGEGDFAPGDGIKLWGDSFKYSPSICYEVVYPQYVRRVKAAGAELLVNITNDGWFGDSPAPYQHANICKFRAIEAGIPIARCANSGISLFYDMHGRTLAKTKLFERTVLRREIPLISRDTFYYRIGDMWEGFLFWFWVCIHFWPLLMWFKERK